MKNDKNEIRNVGIAPPLSTRTHYKTLIKIAFKIDGNKISQGVTRLKKCWKTVPEIIHFKKIWRKKYRVVGRRKKTQNCK